MSLLVVTTGRVASGAEEQARSAATELALECRTDPRCLEYRVCVDPAEPGALIVIELWDGDDALAAHVQHDHTRRFLEAITPISMGVPEVRKGTVV